MKRRSAVVWMGLCALLWTINARAQTQSVKESPLTRVRTQLMHYDLAPQGTLALLPQLAEYARTLPGAEGAEAAFLRAAAANDLLFLADYTQNEALRTGLAAEFGVAPEALSQAIGSALQACAHGVYREPALAELTSLQRTAAPAEPPGDKTDLRRDAAFLHAAAALIGDAAVGARFAAHGVDPCAGKATCPAPYADFDPEGRRALAYVQQLSAAAARLQRQRGVVDPFAEAIAATVDSDIAKLREVVLRLPPRLPHDLRLMLPGGNSAWPAPDLIVFVGTTDLQYALVPRVRVGTDGKFERLPDSGPTFPQTVAIKHAIPDTSPPTRSIEAFVNAVRSTRGEAPDFRAALVAEASVPSQYVARALVSLRKGGVQQLVVASRTRDGAVLGVPLRVVLPTVDGPGTTPDLKLRVRLGGYSLDVGHGTIDIPRVRDESGFHFDLATLRTAAAKRAPKSAAVSFMADVATEQVLTAAFHVTPALTPIDLVIQ